MSTDKQARQGGARANAGVKAADGATGLKRFNVTLDPASDEIAKRLGGGDRSLGLRLALQIAKDRKPA